MQNITKHIKTWCPELILWTRFPGLISFTGLIGGIWISSIIPQYSFIHRHTVCFWLLSIVLLSAALLINKNHFRFVLFLFTGGLIFQIKVQDYCSQVSGVNSFCATQSEVFVSGTVVSNPAPTQHYSFIFQLKTDSIFTEDRALNVGKTFICQGPQAPLYGSVVSLHGKVTAPSQKNTPLVFNDFSYLFSNDILARMAFDNLVIVNRNPSGLTRINGIVRNYVLEVISNLTNADYRSVLRAAFIGESRFLPEEIKQKFRKSGIYHLLAISGLHAAILTAAAFAFLFFIPVHNNIKRCIVIAILWLYQMFIGWQASLFRATIMASMLIAAFLFERKQYTLQSLGIAGTVVLILSPAVLFSPGFQLSFAATAGILILYPRLAGFKAGFGPPFFQTIINHLYTSFSISLCGFLFTAPVLIHHFGTISFFGLIANIAAVVIMTSAMWLFFISLLLQPVLPVMVSALSKVLSIHFDALFGIADLANHLPFGDLQLPVPGSAVTVAYLIFITGLATVKLNYLRQFSLLAIPLFILTVSAKLTFDIIDKDIHLMQYSDSYSSWSAVRWPGGKVWLINDRLFRFKKTNQNNIVNQWMRQFAGSHLEKVFNAGYPQSFSATPNTPDSPTPDEPIPIGDSLLLECPGNRVVKGQSNSCILYNSQSALQMSIFYDSDTFFIEQPPVRTSDESVLLKTLR